jgi:hypothetical protein
MPNPSQAGWEVAWPGERIMEWQLFDAQGQIIFSGRPLSGTSHFRIEGGALPAGLYHLQMVSASQHPTTTRLLKVSN